MGARALVAAAAALAFAASRADAKKVFFDNTKPRMDKDGAIMDAHDSSVHKYPTHPGWYYMHAVAYGGCKEPANLGCDQTSDKCGFQMNHTINIWRSRDLSSGSWEFRGVAIAPGQRPNGTLYRPDAIWNPNTQQVVLYWNFVYPNGTYAGYAAATAPGPEGPFTLQRDVVPIPHNNATSHCGDFHLFVDADNGNTPYIIAGCNFVMYVMPLAPDMLSGTGESTHFDEYFIEAPQLFKRGATYYALFSWCCCYCYQGSGIIVHTAPHPMGPWTAQGPDIACVKATGDAGGDQAALGGPHPAGLLASRGYDGDYAAAWAAAAGAGGGDRLVGAEPTPGQGCQRNDTTMTSALHAQQSFIIQVDTPGGGVEFIWTGDRWQQSWDGTKGHDPQTWVPLVFDAVDGSVAPARWVDNFTLDVV